MVDQGNEDNYERAKTFYVIVTVVLVVFGFVMLMSALTPTLSVEDFYNPPYFIGGYFVGPTAFVCCWFCLVFDKKDETVREESLFHDVRGHYSITITMAVGCILGTILALCGTVALPEDASGFDKAFAAINLTGCILGILMVIVYGFIMGRYGKYLSRYRQNEPTVRGNTNDRSEPTATGNTDDTSESTVTCNANNRTKRSRTSNTNGARGCVAELSTNAVSLMLGDIHTIETNKEISELKSQNQLLQEELERQKELNEQLLQEHRQHGEPTFDPEEPPPSYESVKR